MRRLERDLRWQAQARSGDGEATWLGVPWRGRPPRSTNSASTLENTTVAMLRAAFGLSGELPEPAEPPIAAELSQPVQTVQRGLVRALADRAWAGSVFANPRPLGDAWSIGEIRQGIEQGRSVVAVLAARLLPGHAAGDTAASGDQPILIIGVTPDGLIYSDPSFSSSLGYGLELSDAEFEAAWQAATAQNRNCSRRKRRSAPA